MKSNFRKLSLLQDIENIRDFEFVGIGIGIWHLL
jgi:hypothetical protein